MSKEKKLYEGPAVGGPFNGQTLESRFSSGVLVVSVPEALAWVYDYVDGQFECRDRDAANGGAQRLVQSKAAKAAEGSTYDVRAYDDGDIPADTEVGL